MATFTLTTTLALPYDEAVEATRAALLGACRPALAYEALSVDPSIAAVLPCNVVVRALDEATTLVEAFDPDAMMGLADNDALHAVAADAKERLTAALGALNSTPGAS